MVDIEHNTLTGSSLHTPKVHKDSHTDGTDDIRSATNAQTGLATAAQVTKLESALQADGSVQMTGDLDMNGNVLYLNETGVDAITMVGDSIVVYNNSNYITVFDGTEVIHHVNVRPITTNTKDLGTNTYKWKDIYGTTLHGALTWAEITGTPSLYPGAGEQAFLDADHTKLNGIETLADVTDSTNVASAGAVMADGSVDITATIVPAVSGSYNLGSSSKLFYYLYTTIVNTDYTYTNYLNAKGTGDISVRDNIVMNSSDIDMNGNALYLNKTGTDAITMVGDSIVVYNNSNYITVFDGTEVIHHVSVRPISTNTKDLGTSTYKWRDAHATTFHGAMRVPTQTPASASASGTTGEIAWDASYIYVCTATNTWKRSALSSW